MLCQGVCNVGQGDSCVFEYVPPFTDEMKAVLDQLYEDAVLCLNMLDENSEALAEHGQTWTDDKALAASLGEREDVSSEVRSIAINFMNGFWYMEAVFGDEDIQLAYAEMGISDEDEQMIDAAIKVLTSGVEEYDEYLGVE